MTRTDFREEALQILADHGDHFWFVHRNHIIARAMRGSCNVAPGELKLLDLGCGAGHIARYMHKKGYNVDASDLYPSALKFLERSIDNSFAFDLYNDEVPDTLTGKYDVVILGDVIEHLLHPVAALKKAGGFLKKNGLIVVTVPALLSLWSEYDEQSGHKKRYDKETLEFELRDSGYRVEAMSYFMHLPGILLYVQRKLANFLIPDKKDYDDCLEINPIVNSTMKVFMYVEYLIRQAVTPPFGSSLIAVGRRFHEG